jgi:NTE family protein
MSPAPSPKIGLALGGGSARGWAHVGVLRGLEKRGIRPDVVCGTSAGALVGAAFALGKLDEIERWLALLQWRDVVGYLDFSFKGGVIKGRRLFDFFAEHVGDRNIEDLAIPFGVVATDLSNGNEIWLRRGSLFAAVRASVSIPGFLQPVKVDGRWLVDGGIVDPVPVALCRELGADIVIGVDINKSLLDEDRPLAATRLLEEEDADADLDPPAADEPSLLAVVERSLYITQSRLALARAAEHPADVLIAPAVGHIGFIEFHRAAESFDAGRSAVELAAADLERVLGRPAVSG